MRHPRILVYEGDGRLAALLRPLVEQNSWLLREVRTLGECLDLLSAGGPAVLVVKPTGRDLEQEFTLLERVGWLCPGVDVVPVLDGDHARLAGLAWDLGAAYVVVPPQSRETLPELVRNLLKSRER